ncbi:MAG: hypothetical protein AB1696_16060 [Planctomycetota bacterium]
MISEKKQNLWGDLPEVKEANTPIVILREQASLVGQMTDNLLEAEVRIRQQDKKISIGLGGEVTESRMTIPDIEACLDIVAPPLDHYTITVVEIRHGVEPYPVFVANRLRGIGVQCDNETVFKEELQKALQSPEVRKVVSSLLTQIKSVAHQS